MKKKTIAVSLMALALLIAPVGGLGSMPSVHAEEGAELVAGSVSGNSSRTTTQKVQLDTPTNLRWGGANYIANDKYSMVWEGVNESTYESTTWYGDGTTQVVLNSNWLIELERDGEYIDYTWSIDKFYENYWDDAVRRWVYTDIPLKEHCTDMNEFIYESGNYKFRVKATAQYDDEAYQDSEWSGWSESITYVRPEQELGVTNIYWDSQKAGVCHFFPLENSEYVACYRAYLYEQTADGTWYERAWISDYDWKNHPVNDVDFSDRISESGEGKYRVSVQAFSNDIDVVAHGKESPMSDILDTTMNAEKLSDILNSAADRNAVEAVELLTNSADISAIQQAMQTSDAFREQIKDLEGRYRAEQDITVESPAVSDAAQEYVDPGKVNVVGAAFNAAQGKAVSLQMDVTPQENRVPVHSGYKKNVQLDIKLVSDDTELHDLSMPVSVTMPIPQGIVASQLVILHYHADGTSEKTAFHVNGDGTITFTVSRFSTFVFAEESAGETPSDRPSQNGSANSSSSGSSAAVNGLEDQIVSAAPGTIVKVTKEQNINTLPGSIMQLLAKRGDVTLDMEYTYEGADYHVIIPAGMAIDNGIAWYGPLYLSAYYGADSLAGSPGTETAAVYIVQKGDTLGRIARSYQTTVARLMAANPQIRNANRIRTGQIINIQ